MFFETGYQIKTVVAKLDELLRRFGRLDGKGTIALFVVTKNDISKGLVLFCMLAFQVGQKGAYCSDKYTNPPQMCHVGKDMHRIKTLLCGIEVKQLLQSFGDILKERILQSLAGNNVAHCPEGAKRNV